MSPASGWSQMAPWLVDAAPRVKTLKLRRWPLPAATYNEHSLAGYLLTTSSTPPAPDVDDDVMYRDMAAELLMCIVSLHARSPELITMHEHTDGPRCKSYTVVLVNL